MAKPEKLDRETREMLAAALEMLDHGEVVLRLHAGVVIGLDVKIRRRLLPEKSQE